MELEIHCNSDSKKGTGSKTVYKIHSWDLKNVNIEPYSFEIILRIPDGSTLKFMIRKQAVLGLRKSMSNGLFEFTWNLHKVSYNLKMKECSCVRKIANFFKYVWIEECDGSQSVKHMLSEVLCDHTNVTDLTGKVFPK